MTESTAMNRITHAFDQAKATQSAALMPYFTLGYPDPETSIDIIERFAPHCDLIELGVPFSDPIADGPTIQRSTQQALDAGTTVKKCLSIVAELRNRGVDTPAMLMGYYNPILAYGIDNYVRDAKAAGADGLIVPDLPPEESEELEAAADKYGIAYIFFLAPTSNEARIDAVAERAKGFIYMVSVAGVTGARTQIRAGLDEFVHTIRAKAAVPIAVGFGISNPEQASTVGAYADGVIVGSALVNAYDAGGIDDAGEFVETLRKGLDK